MDSISVIRVECDFYLFRVSTAVQASPGDHSYDRAPPGDRGPGDHLQRLQRAARVGETETEGS